MLAVLCYQVRILMVKQKKKIILAISSDSEAKFMVSGNLSEEILAPGTCRSIFSVTLFYWETD